MHIQGEADGFMDFLHFPLRQPGDSRFQIGLRNRQQRVAGIPIVKPQIAIQFRLPDRPSL